VKYVDPRNTSRICSTYGGELSSSPNGRRLMKYQKCGLEKYRDMIAVRNLTHRYYEEYMNAKTLTSL
jgi:transposase